MDYWEERTPFKVAMTFGLLGALLAVSSLGALVAFDFEPAKYGVFSGLAAMTILVAVLVFYLIRDMWR